eukprot:Opistho-2@52062
MELWSPSLRPAVVVCVLCEWSVGVVLCRYCWMLFSHTQPCMRACIHLGYCFVRLFVVLLSCCRISRYLLSLSLSPSHTHKHTHTLSLCLFCPILAFQYSRPFQSHVRFMSFAPVASP